VIEYPTKPTPKIQKSWMFNVKNPKIQLFWIFDIERGLNIGIFIGLLDWIELKKSNLIQ
jgi:uncharacterized membrane protein